MSCSVQLRMKKSFFNLRARMKAPKNNPWVQLNKHFECLVLFDLIL